MAALDTLGTYFLLSFGSLFAILSPFATVPFFLAITEENSPAERIAMARRACVVACIVLVVFALLGLRILSFFGISVAAFQIAGGLVILRVALEMVKGSRTRMTTDERLEGAEKDDVSITPLAVPGLCGPGTITTGILLSSQAASWLHSGVLVANIVMVYTSTFVLLHFASRYSHLFGEITLKIITRLTGLLLVAIAVQFSVDGLRGAQLFTS